MAGADIEAQNRASLASVARLATALELAEARARSRVATQARGLALFEGADGLTSELWAIESRSGAIAITCDEHRYYAIGVVDDRDLVTNVSPVSSDDGPCQWCI